MTLATIPRSSSPVRLPISPGRQKAREAARLLQQALDALYEEDRARAEARARRDAEVDAKAKTHVDRARLRALKQQHMLSVDRKWFWDSHNETLDLLRAIAADAQKRGETSDARMVERHIDGMCTALEKIQAKEAATK
jgi:hypothetical protein